MDMGLKGYHIITLGSSWLLDFYTSIITGSPIWAFKGGFEGEFRYCWWYRSNHGTDLEISELAR